MMQMPARSDWSADARTIGAFAGSSTRPEKFPFPPRSWLYGIEKARRYIRQYRTIILVEGIFDYFAFYNLLQGQDKLVVVSTLGSYLTPRRRAFLKALISSTILPPTTGTNSAETASNGLRPNQAGGSITLAVWQKVRPLTIC
jgi:hypothetical protein